MRSNKKEKFQSKIDQLRFKNLQLYIVFSNLSKMFIPQSHSPSFFPAFFPTAAAAPPTAAPPVKAETTVPTPKVAP